MNSQKRNIDVWLIYRCVKCDSTYNITLLSRTRPELIKKELFKKFSENNELLARQYAFDPIIAAKNKVEPDYSYVKYEIVYDPVSTKDLSGSHQEKILFRIKTDFDFDLKISTMIKKCLGLSASQLKKWIEKDVILLPGNRSLKKCKVRNGDTVQINPENLKNSL